MKTYNLQILAIIGDTVKDSYPSRWGAGFVVLFDKQQDGKMIKKIIRDSDEVKEENGIGKKKKEVKVRQKIVKKSSYIQGI